MMEFTSIKQGKDELVVDYINRWQMVILDYKDQFSKISTVKICIQGIHWDLTYIHEGIKPQNFEELSTRDHDMKLRIASHGKTSHIFNPRK